MTRTDRQSPTYVRASIFQSSQLPPGRLSAQKEPVFEVNAGLIDLLRTVELGILQHRVKHHFKDDREEAQIVYAMRQPVKHRHQHY